MLLGVLLLVLAGIGVAAAAGPRGSDADTAPSPGLMRARAATDLGLPRGRLCTISLTKTAPYALCSRSRAETPEYMNAMRAAQRQIIAEALQAGDITQVQADRLTAWMDRELREDFGSRRFGRHRRMDDLNPERLLSDAAIFDESGRTQSVAVSR